MEAMKAMKAMRMRLFADTCEVSDCVPFSQVENGRLLTRKEAVAFGRTHGYGIAKHAILVEFCGRVFAKAEDMAVCLGYLG
jgi:hypothetical protein